MQDAQLTPASEDQIAWRWTPSATYTARSAYRLFFEGSTRFAGARPIWKAWAPLKVKFFTWLAVRRCIWTADRRHRHGLQDMAACPHCDQEWETADHLFIDCVYARQVWHTILSSLQIPVPPANANMLEWWLLLRCNTLKFHH
jgi:hypothetical protein